MQSLKVRKLLTLGVCLLVVASAPGCKESNSVETITVSITNAERFQYPTAGGDEEGATISHQAQHHRISEIRRSAETNWVATYVYQAAPGFVGSDYAAIEIVTGSDGASSPRSIKTVAFHFTVRD